MKTLFKIIFLMLPFFAFSISEEPPITKQKTINKAYFVNADANLKIENKYGNIAISTWDENKIELNIVIKVSGDSQKWVDKRLDDIDVTIEAFQNRVEATTIIGNSDFYNNGNSNSFEISYVVKIPKNGSINIDNKYGKITADDLNANTDIVCKYGKVLLSKLNGNKNVVELGYCPNSEIEFADNLTVDAKYSGLKIGEVKKLNLDSNYTDVTVIDGKTINYDSNYGKLKFEKVNSIVGSGNYLTVKIDVLQSNLNIETTYSKLTVGLINENAKNIIINAGYTNIDVGFADNYAFDLDMQSKYGSVRYDGAIEVYNKETTPNFKQINGFHKRKGVNSMNIIAKYGNVVLTKM